MITIEEKIIMKEIGTIGNFTISKKLKKQIDYLHFKIGSTEWSGILLYKHNGGKIEKMKDLAFKADDLFLYDIGNAVATEFDYNTDVIDMYDNVKDAMECAMGLIHTHHNMGAYHSGVDMSELNKNTENYNYYISLVVDFKADYKCKIGFPSKSTITYENKVRDTNGKWVDNEVSVEESIILLGDLDVVIEGEKERKDWFSERYDTVVNNKKIKEAEEKASRIVYHGNFSKNYNLEIPKHFNTSEEYYAHNWPESRDFGENNKVVSADRLTRKFLVAILNMDSTVNKDINKSILSLESLNDIDFEQYIVFLEGNLELLHDNIYGTNAFDKMDDHILEVIEFLNDRPDIGDNISQLLITLQVATI